ncbi:accessory Sec system translocase SecA2 [Bacillus sp. SG-1]|uniref:accessory Sec system translocase SecA2 n=1 Tax=Bacillus sp. SG-1 TaxID=161544 RepID=UPI0001545137|nr:accessory Sec system translocase SecA2 [Bacillus sp. SG-1]EDL64349.1 translocase [Bacillus sp. SG-1]
MIKNIKKFISDSSFKELRRLKKELNRINSLESTYKKMSDKQLQEQVSLLRKRLVSGASINEIIHDAFALVRETSERVLGMRHHDVQILGGLSLAEGNIAEMQTGEGKTLVAALPSFLHALQGRGVHVITANEYLARRDFEHIGSIHTFLGLSVGLNISGLTSELKQEAYQKDITYGTANEFGFDYLRDHMVTDNQEKVQRPLYFSIIDEIDSILIDEARTPLIIANKSNHSAELYNITSIVVRSFEEESDYEYYPESKQIYLTDEGTTKVEEAFGISNLFDAEHQILLHFIMQSLRAHVIMKRDVDYIVRNEQALLVDPFTGRIMEGRSYSDGLQQAIEAKEGIPIQDENQTMASITVQNYFKLYELVSGMTGTAATEKKEFFETYGMNVIEIPTNKPTIRVDFQDLIYNDLPSKLERIMEEVKQLNKSGRPVLIGTTSIEQSEKIAEEFTKNGIPFELLNAKTEEQEAQIIAKAGQKGKVTIATNMAGRGTDIAIDTEVRDLGGLHIIGTDRHESRRIDNQLRGRSGRQGDPGSTQFILSMDDRIITYYDDEDVRKWKKKVKTDTTGLILQPNPIKFLDKIQLTVESSHFSSRSSLVRFDNIIDQQRRAVYSQRNRLLANEDIFFIVKELIEANIASIFEKYCPKDQMHEEWNIRGLVEEISLLFPFANLKQEDFENLEYISLKERIETVKAEAFSFMETHSSMIEVNKQMKSITLAILDQVWVEHLENMEKLKEGVHLQAFGQEDPFRYFEREGYEMFLYLLQQLHSRIARRFSVLIRQYFDTKSEVNS